MERQSSRVGCRISGDTVGGRKLWLPTGNHLKSDILFAGLITRRYRISVQPDHFLAAANPRFIVTRILFPLDEAIRIAMQGVFHELGLAA